MEITFYIVLGLIIGGIIAYLFLKLSWQKDLLPKSQFDHLQTEFNDFKIQSATRVSKEDLTKNYVSKELFDQLNLNYQAKEREIEGLKRDNSEFQQRLPKEEVEKNYVAKESYEIVKTKLTSTEQDLKESRGTILNLNTQLTELRKEEENLNEKLTTFKTEIENLHTLSREQFKNLATTIIEEKSKSFVETNKNELNNIINPLKTDITNFKKTIEDTRKEDIKDLTSLKKEIESLEKLNNQLSDDAQQLANALKSEVKVQGNWGEDRLKLILEAEGLQKYIDFTSQDAYRDEEERKRYPDCIIRLPDGKHLVIDSKVSLNAYVEYFNADNPDEKKKYLKQLVKNINDHIDNLSSKNYQSLTGLNTPDFIFMFMDFESALTLAFNESPDIFNRALNKKIVIVTPTTLLATAKVVKLLWQKENRVKNVEEIFKQCGLLYDKFVLFIEAMQKIGAGLNSAAQSYHDAMDRLKDGARRGDTIIGKFETIKKLEARTNKILPQNLINEVELLDDDTEIKMLESGEDTDFTEKQI